VIGRGLSHREVSGVCDLDSFWCGLISEKVVVGAVREAWDSLGVKFA